MMRNTTHSPLRAVIAALLAAAVMLPVCGCSKQSEATATLRLSGIMGDAARADIYRDVLSEFSADHPSVYLRDITTAPEDAFKLELNIAGAYSKSDSPHIVYYYNNEDMKALADTFVSVQEIREDIPGFLANTGANAIECAAWEDGKTYCIPIAADWNAVAVHSSMLTNYGLSMPSTRDELLYAVDILSMNGIIPFANSAEDSALIIEALVRGEGGQAALENGVTGSGSALDPIWTDALEFYRTLCLHNAFAPSALTDTLARFVSAPTVYDSVLGADRDKSRSLDPVELFEDGKAAMLALDRETYMRLSDKEGVVLIDPPFAKSAPPSTESIPSGASVSDLFSTADIPSGASVSDLFPMADIPSGASVSDLFSMADTPSGASVSDLFPMADIPSGASVSGTASDTDTSAAAGTSSSDSIPENTSDSDALSSPSDASSTDIPAPVVTETDAAPEEKPPKDICAGYSEGFYITRKAYSDPALRPLIVELIERFAGEGTGARMAALGYIPSDKRVRASVPGLEDMTASAAAGARYTPSLVCASNRSRYSYIQRCAVQLWYGLATPRSMTELLGEESRNAVDVLEELQQKQEEQAAYEAAQEAAREEAQAAVSGTDTQPPDISSPSDVE